MGTKRLIQQFCALALLGFLAAALPAAAKPPVADVRIGATAATFTPGASHGGLELRVTGPRGFVHQEAVGGPGGVVVFHYVDSSGAALPDGQYAYELRLNPARRTKVRVEGSEASAWKSPAEVLAGTFTIQGGAALDPNVREEPRTKDIVHADDVIITGSLCVGFDCANGEDFGFDTIRLKENNLRIKFLDTSTGSFPSTDWQLTANDSASGGANKFSIEDVTTARVPFTITGGAPTSSLFVDSSGRVGVGTGTPVLNVHIASGNTPALRLEQNGSSGFTAQVWDIAGNEANFFVRDVTGGSRLPFRIQPGAPTNSVFIASSGNVGVGTLAPANNLHVSSSASTNLRVTGTAAGFQLEESDSSNLRVQDLLDNNLYRIRGIDSAAAETAVGISMEVSGNTVGINCNDAGDAGTGAQLIVGDGGTCASGSFSAIIAGSGVINTSSRTLKENLQAVQARNILEKIAGIDVYTYDFISGARDVMGLMAEDFHGLFGRGSDKMINSQEVQMALWLAVQELTAHNRELAEQNKEIAERLAALESEFNTAD